MLSTWWLSTAPSSRTLPPPGSSANEYSTLKALPALMLPVILLGGIYGGITTPTEAAAVAAAYAFVVSAVLYRSIGLSDLWETLKQSTKSAGSIGVLIAGSITFNYVITREDLPNKLAHLMANFELSTVGFLLMVNALVLALGCVLEGGAILLIAVPIMIPAAQAMGVDLVHFGVIVVVNAMMGLITPPYGILLFIVASITKQPLAPIVRDLLPFILALFVALMIITFVPDFVLYVPRLLGYKG